MIGILIKATIIKNETKNNFIFKILVFIFLINLSLNEYSVTTRYVCATNSKIMKSLLSLTIIQISLISILYTNNLMN